MTAQAQAAALYGEIRAHKAAIRQHRGALARAKVALLQLEKDCAARGIKLVIGEGEAPWPRPFSTSTR